MCRILCYEREKYEIFYSGSFIKGTHSDDIGWCWVLLIFGAGAVLGEKSHLLDILTLFRCNDIITMIFMNAAPQLWSSVTLSVATLDILTGNDSSHFQMGGPNHASSSIDIEAKQQLMQL